MNWLSRFLHIKPASKILCFQVGRGKVRQDLVRLLRDWQRFGVRDVSFDRSTNVINARVDKSNRKYPSCSGFIFGAWSLNAYRFEVELLAAKPTSSRNCTFPLPSLYANSVLTILNF
jgi:serine/threonine-protein kinase HSL1 (negative regulator of Swe1 kinase)